MENILESFTHVVSSSNTPMNGAKWWQADFCPRKWGIRRTRDISVDYKLEYSTYYIRLVPFGKMPP